MHAQFVFGVVAILLAIANGGKGCEEGAFSPHESDCNQYYRCVHGKNNANRCGSGLYWNQNAKACDWPANSGCTSGSSSATDATTTTTTTTTTTPRQQQETTKRSNGNGRTGKCSWYGEDGEIPPNSYTACGNIFNRDLMASAHPDVPNFPCGTRVRVKNLENGKTVDVTVDDKGPDQRMFPDRILDLTRGAFDVIADRKQGTVRCSYEVL